MRSVTLERGEGLLWIWIAVLLAAALLVALQLEKPIRPPPYEPDRSITGLQHKKPSPCIRRDSANCVPIKP